MRVKQLFLFACYAVVLILTANPAFASKANDTLVWSTASAIDTPDIYYQNEREVVILAQNMCDSLIYHNPTTKKYQPLLATSYKWINNKTLEFKLRHGVKFWDGSDFTAKDVAYTLNFLRKPEHGMVTRLLVDWIADVQVTGPYTVRIHAKKPTPAAIAYLSGALPIYPSGHYDKAPVIAGSSRHDWGAVMPVCTGPYKLANFEPGKSVTLVKNNNYFKDSPKGQPHIGKLIFRTISDADTQIANLVTGSIDWLWSVPSDNVKQLRDMGSVTVKSAPTTRISFLSLDAAGRSGKTPFKDQRVREAVGYAIDNKALAQLVGKGALPLKSMCYPAQFGCAQDVKQYPYDPQKAKQLLAKAGYPHGFKVAFYAYRNRPYSEAVMNYLRKVGIKSDFHFLQWKALYPVITRGKVPIAQLTWGSQGVMDASASVSHYFEFGPDDYARDAQVRDWLEQADRTPDNAKRKKLYKNALKRIATKAYFIPLFTYSRNYAFDKDLDYPVTADEIAHFYMAKWK